ncbi:MAG: PAS domain S-box protein [Caulobacteraceae bacterium]|nr:PAS domain S-box protein [Caulobacteraceae bacterium]
MSTTFAGAPSGPRKATAVLIGLAAFATLALLSLLFAREAGRVAAIWPANGALLALVLLRPKADRLWLIVGALIGNIGVTLAMGDALPISLGLSLANALEVGVVAWLMRGVDAREAMLSARPLARFAVAGGLIGPAASATVAAATLALWHSEAFLPNVERWLVADALGMLIVAPPLLLLFSRGAWAKKTSVLSKAAMGALLVGVLALVFLQSAFPLLFLVPPVLILIAFRCGAGPASIGLLVATAASLAAVAVGTGPIALVDGGLDQRAMIQQVFLAILVFTTLPVAAVLRDKADGEARYRLLAETATDVVARFDRKGRFLFVSPAARAVLGRDPEGMIGKDCAGIIPEEDLAVIRQTLIDYVAAGPDAPTPRYEYRALKADGTPIWLEATPRAIRDETGQLVEFHDCVRDVTDRKAAERAQQELVETLSLAEDLAGLGSWKLDVATGQVRWSDQVYLIHGVTPQTFDPSLDDAVGFYHPDDRQAVRDWCARAIETGEAGEFQLRLIRADGEERTVVSRCRPQRDEEGRTTALFGVFQDVTEAVENTRRLAESEERHRLLAERSTDVIITYGVDGITRYYSPVVEALTGFTPEELVGKPVTKLIHPDDVAEMVAGFRTFAADRTAVHHTRRYRVLTKSGEVRWFETRAMAMRDAEGRALEFQDLVRDVTETKRLEDELVAARDVAEAAAKAKTEFLANMSHELRTPLTSVVGFAGLLQEAGDRLGAKERLYADRIATASQALLSVINDILDYSKLEADRVDLDPHPFDPRALARGAAGIVESQCAAKGVGLAVIVDPDLPAALMGDEGRLRQVTLNFLSNATKFTGNGGIRLEVGRRGDRLRVAVSDTGIGIAPEKIDALFERFTQADASTTRTYGGTGLGLAISRRLIEMMGGEIGAESRPGQGSTFWFEVPLIVAEGQVAAVAAENVDAPTELKVLMADDAPANRELVTAILGGLGVAIETVENGALAVEAARSGAYDVILMDVHMPVMDGLDATRAIRAMAGPVGRTPIVALTANVQPEQVAACRAAGMDAHVGKPIQVAELLRTMAELTAEAEATDEAPARSVG